eukprot:1626150-Prymnesium_polylepis.1
MTFSQRLRTCSCTLLKTHCGTVSAGRAPSALHPGDAACDAVVLGQDPKGTHVANILETMAKT